MNHQYVVCSQGRAKEGKRLRRKERTSITPVGLAKISHCVFVPPFIAFWRVPVALLGIPLVSRLRSKMPVVSVKKHPVRYRDDYTNTSKISVPTILPIGDKGHTLSPIALISFLLILPFSGTSMNSPIESSSLKINTNGSRMEHARILALGLAPSLSGMDWRSEPSGRKG
jgi:hypothetical protein